MIMYCSPIKKKQLISLIVFINIKTEHKSEHAKNYYAVNPMKPNGEVSERFKVQTWNVCVGATRPRVRISPSPFYYLIESLIVRMLFFVL